MTYVGYDSDLTTYFKLTVAVTLLHFHTGNLLLLGLTTTTPHLPRVGCVLTTAHPPPPPQAGGGGGGPGGGGGEMQIYELFLTCMPPCFCLLIRLVLSSLQPFVFCLTFILEIELHRY